MTNSYMWVYRSGKDGGGSPTILYEYQNILEEIPKHMDEKNTKFLEDLLPWSKNLPGECKKQSN